MMHSGGLRFKNDERPEITEPKFKMCLDQRDEIYWQGHIQKYKVNRTIKYQKQEAISHCKSRAHNKKHKRFFLYIFPV